MQRFEGLLGLVLLLGLALVLGMLATGQARADGGEKEDVVMKAAPTNLGVHEGLLAPMPDSPNAVSSQTGMADKHVDPLPLHGDVATTRAHILATLQAMGGNTVEFSGEDYVYAVFVTPLLRFRDDVEFYIDAPAGVVHFRSASRVGYSDLGANRRRYERFRELYAR